MTNKINTTKDSRSSVLWWIGWITLTILSFFVSSFFWTGFIAAHVGPMRQAGVPILWVAAVFGSWMMLLIPLIIVMYSKVDKAYEEARIARELKVRNVFVAEADRRLRRELSEKLAKIPETIRQGHLVTVTLNDGRKFENIFVRDKKDVLGVYDAEALPFRVHDIADVEPADLDRLPQFKAEKWLRLDGV